MAGNSLAQQPQSSQPFEQQQQQPLSGAGTGAVWNPQQLQRLQAFQHDFPSGLTPQQFQQIQNAAANFSGPGTPAWNLQQLQRLQAFQNDFPNGLSPQQFGLLQRGVGGFQQAGNAGSILGNLAQPQQATFSIPEDFQQQIRQIRQQQVGQVFQDRFGYPLGSPPPPAAQQRLLNLLQQYYPGSQTPVGINFALGNAFTPATFPTAPQRLSPPIQLSLGQPKIAPGQPPLTPSIIQALKQAYARRGIPQR